jgi:CRISPR-associated protein Csb2
LLYLWTFEETPEAQQYALRICAVAERLYQLGRGVDMAWACGAVLDDGEAAARLAAHHGPVHRPSRRAGGRALAVPCEGSLASLIVRYRKTGERLQTLYQSKPTAREPGREVAAGKVFVQLPKPRFGQIAYDSPPVRLLYDLVGEMSSWRLDRVVELTRRVRDAAAKRLESTLPAQGTTIENIIIGRRDADEADKSARLRITPLPSIGHAHADHAIRRILVEIPPNCPLRADDVEWAFSGLEIIGAEVDPATGEVRDRLLLASAGERGMLAHYGIAPEASFQLWHTVTPAALPQAPRRGSDATRLRAHRGPLSPGGCSGCGR